MLLGCQGTDDPGTTQNELNAKFEAFENFPVFQYYDIQLGQDFKEADLILTKNGFEKIEENESSHYWREKDSTEVILYSNTDISKFRIFLHSHQFLADKGGFYSFFEQKTTKIDKNGPFRVLSYSFENTSFQLSIYEHENYLRLNFEVD